MASIPRREFLVTTIREAGQLLMQHFGHVGVDHAKDGDPHSVVTIADIAAHRYIEEQIHLHFPGDAIVSEEDEASHGNTTAERVWIIDPIDGTRNFASRVPLFGILIAYAEHGSVVLSSIYLPTTDELFIAEKGKGGTINGQPLVISMHTDFASSYGSGPVKDGREAAVRFTNAIHAAYPDISPWVNSLGSVAVSAAYFADGRRDWFLSRGGYVWDYAAPSLILKEAGAIVTNDQGEPWHIGDRSIVAANSHLHAELLRLVQWKG